MASSTLLKHSSRYPSSFDCRSSSSSHQSAISTSSDLKTPTAARRRPPSDPAPTAGNSSRALARTKSADLVRGRTDQSNFSSMVKKFMEKRSKPKADRTALIIPADFIAEDLKKTGSRGSNLSGLPKKLFQKATGSSGKKETKALTEVKANTRTLAMVLRSERELLSQNKEQEALIGELQLMLEEKNREVEKLKDLCLNQREEIKALKSAILFPDVMNSQLNELVEKQGSELRQAKQVIPALQKQVTSLTGQLQCLAEDLAEVKADKYAMKAACFDGHVSSPRTPIHEEGAANSLEFSSGDPVTPIGSPDDMFLKDLNPCLTPYYAKEKSKVDLTGGYYDAGDNIKFGFPMAFTTTMLAWSVIDFGKNMGPELGNALDAVRWATDYLLKATAVPNTIYVQVGNAFSDHSCWERPEDMDTPRTVYKVDTSHPGSDVAGETAAALAAASIVFRWRDPAYSRLLLQRAVSVFDFADKYRGAYSSSLRSAVCPFYCDFNGYEDELLWGAAWLHKASRRRKYREYIKSNEVVLGASDTINEFGWDNKHAGINVLISKQVAMGKADYLQSFKQYADRFICTLLPGASHPQIQYSPGGLIFKTGGSNMQHVTSLSFLLLAYSNYISHSNQLLPCGGISATPAQLKRIAKRQVDYILGDNPMKMSYMVGYGKRYPQRIHHRASSLPSVSVHSAHIGCKAGTPYYLSPKPNPNTLVGAVVGGPNITDKFPDSRTIFQQSEPTTYINAPLVGLLGYFSAHPNTT